MQPYSGLWNNNPESGAAFWNAKANTTTEAFLSLEAARLETMRFDKVGQDQGSQIPIPTLPTTLTKATKSLHHEALPRFRGTSHLPRPRLR